MMTNHNTKAGTRVRVTVYGVVRTGTVETVRNVAWVRMDDSKLLRWFHWESLSPLETPSAFDRCELHPWQWEG